MPQDTSHYGLGLQVPAGSGPLTPRRPVTPQPGTPLGIVVFSGGSAANNLVDVFESVRADNECALSYVIPISDNGGSTSEIIRVFGGPGMHRNERGWLGQERYQY